MVNFHGFPWNSMEVFHTGIHKDLKDLDRAECSDGAMRD